MLLQAALSVCRTTCAGMCSWPQCAAHHHSNCRATLISDFRCILPPSAMLQSPQLSHSALCWRRAASYLLHRSCVEASAGLPVQARCRCGRAGLSRRAPSACAGDQDHCRCGPGGPAKCWQEHSTPCHFSCTARGVTPLTCTSTVLHEQQWCLPATCYPQLTVLRVSSAWQQATGASVSEAEAQLPA